MQIVFNANRSDLNEDEVDGTIKKEPNKHAAK